MLPACLANVNFTGGYVRLHIGDQRGAHDQHDQLAENHDDSSQHNEREVPAQGHSRKFALKLAPHGGADESPEKKKRHQLIIYVAR
jgi:hypothetical protein